MQRLHVVAATSPTAPPQHHLLLLLLFPPKHHLPLLFSSITFWPPPASPKASPTYASAAPHTVSAPAAPPWASLTSVAAAAPSPASPAVPSVTSPQASPSATAPAAPFLSFISAPFPQAWPSVSVWASRPPAPPWASSLYALNIGSAAPHTVILWLPVLFLLKHHLSFWSSYCFFKDLLPANLSKFHSSLLVPFLKTSYQVLFSVCLTDPSPLSWPSPPNNPQTLPTACYSSLHFPCSTPAPLNYYSAVSSKA